MRDSVQVHPLGIKGGKVIIDRIRDINEFKKLFDSRPMPEGSYSYDNVINNPHLYCFYSDSNLLKGFIFINQNSDGKLFLSGVSIPKNLPDIKDAIIKVCDTYKQDMYAATPLKQAVYALLKAGFKHYKDDIYIRRFKNGV